MFTEVNTATAKLPQLMTKNLNEFKSWTPKRVCGLKNFTHLLLRIDRWQVVDRVGFFLLIYPWKIWIQFSKHFKTLNYSQCTLLLFLNRVKKTPWKYFSIQQIHQQNLLCQSKSNIPSDPKSFSAGCLQYLVIQPNSKMMLPLAKTGLFLGKLNCFKTV